MAGRLHVDEVLAELSGDEIAEWQAYYALEPWGDDWKRTALLAMLMAETHRNQDQRKEPFTIEDFMPTFASEEAEEDEEPGEPDWRRWKQTFAILAGAQKDNP